MHWYQRRIDDRWKTYLKETDNIGLSCLLQSNYSTRLKAEFRAKVLRNLANQPLKRHLSEQQVRRLLVLPDLTQSDSPCVSIQNSTVVRSPNYCPSQIWQTVQQQTRAITVFLHRILRNITAGNRRKRGRNLLPAKGIPVPSGTLHVFYGRLLEACHGIPKRWRGIKLSDFMRLSEWPISKFERET